LWFRRSLLRSLGGNFDLEWYSPTLYGNSGMKFSGTVLMSASFLT